MAEQGEGRFALTDLGEGLREDVAGSLRGSVLARGELYWEAAAGLVRATREGGAAFEHVHGRPFFEHLAADPEGAGAFQASMADRARREAADVVAAYDFSGLGEIVDVGGGSGVLLEAILGATPGLRGVLVDRPEAVERARERLRRRARGPRRVRQSATSSTRSRRAPAPTCSRASSTTGTTTRRDGSSPRAAPRCPMARACSSSTRSSPSGRRRPRGDPHGPAHARPLRRP